MIPPRIDPATEADLGAVRDLMRAYASSLGIDLGYQEFERELAELPGAYTPPRGALLVARGQDETPVGCVALRPLSDLACEMKRLYVRPEMRGHKVGAALVDAVLAEAVRMGYAEMKLDTLDSLQAAIGLYRSRGFEQTESYYDTPVACTVFMAKRLR